jgi:hypothetical protein
VKSDEVCDTALELTVGKPPLTSREAKLHGGERLYEAVVQWRQKRRARRLAEAVMMPRVIGAIC